MIKLITNALSNPLLRNAVLLSLLCVTVGCQQTPKETANSMSDNTKKSATVPEALEAIYGFEHTRDQVTFLVKSTGCTKTEHFDIELEKTTQAEYTITLIRHKQDMCRAMPRLYPVNLPLGETLSEKEQLTVANPYGLNNFSKKKLG